MLSNPSNRHYRFEEDLDFIHNYYERLVLQEITATSPRVQAGDREFLADVACVALNRLPPRYIRHDVDMTFFMSPQEIQEIEDKIAHAVKAAIAYVESRERGEVDDIPAEAGKRNETKKSVKTPASDKKSGSKKSARQKSST